MSRPPIHRMTLHNIGFKLMLVRTSVPTRLIALGLMEPSPEQASQRLAALAKMMFLFAIGLHVWQTA